MTKPDPTPRAAALQVWQDLFALAKENGLSKKDIAKKVGVSATTISRIATGKTVGTLENLLLVAGVVEVKISWVSEK